MKKWKKDKSIEHLFFFQDTNPFGLASLPILLGVSLEKKCAINFLSVKIKPGEPYGTMITDENGKTYNIEYNVFSKVLKEAGIQENLDD